MTIFKNKQFIKRDYECTNIVACIADKAPNDNWEEAAPDFDTSPYQHIYTQNGVQYYGFL